MTREEAIELLEDLDGAVEDNHGRDYDEAFRMAIEALNAEWVPVSERLPDAEECPMDCMVTRKSEFVGNYVDMAVAEANGTWTHEDWKAITLDGKAMCISTRDADIIAWMPLPEPYRKDGEW